MALPVRGCANSLFVPPANYFFLLPLSFLSRRGVAIFGREGAVFSREHTFALGGETYIYNITACSTTFLFVALSFYKVGISFWFSLGSALPAPNATP